MLVSTNISHNSTFNITINATTTTTTTTQTTPRSTTPIPFANASFDASFNFTMSDLTIDKSLPICNFSITNNDTSIYKVPINQTLYSSDILEQRYGTVLYSVDIIFQKNAKLNNA